MKRSDILNLLIRKNNYKSYLEIGLSRHDNYPHVKIEKKIGVDPAKTSYRDDSTKIMTSDAFFSSLSKDEKFDIIFIDGLHLEEQVDKDIVNSLSHLNDNGVIVMHDCNPPTAHHARLIESQHTPAGKAWFGTVWRSFVKMRYIQDKYFTCVVDTDCGCGIIKEAAHSNSLSKPSLEESLTWEIFDKDRNNILNLISPSQFNELVDRGII